MQKQNILLQGLHCQACKKITEKRIGSLQGVESVSVDIDSQYAILVAQRVISKDEINKALEGTDYKAI
jgi:copper chaperone CopZ